jgi:MarR family transcriptional regulator, organic hydroperoxide resistance regulator
MKIDERHDELADAVWSLMAGFFFRVGMRHMAQSSRSTGLHPGAIKALQSLDPEVPRPMGALADSWGCDASNVTWIVDRLEERGLVERRTSATDRRVKTVVLTEAGLATRRDIDAIWSEAPDQVRALDTKDLMVLVDVLRRLRAG